MSPLSITERLFVYGTLAPGRSNHHLLKDIPGIWKTATLKGKLLNEGWGSAMGYPALIPSEDGDEIEGYVFSSEHLTEYWSALDEFEGDGYRRVVVDVRVDDDTLLKAYVYALNRED